MVVTLVSTATANRSLIVRFIRKEVAKSCASNQADLSGGDKQVFELRFREKNSIHTIEWLRWIPKMRSVRTICAWAWKRHRKRSPHAAATSAKESRGSSAGEPARPKECESFYSGRLESTLADELSLRKAGRDGEATFQGRPGGAAIGPVQAAQVKDPQAHGRRPAIMFRKAE